MSTKHYTCHIDSRLGMDVLQGGGKPRPFFYGTLIELRAAGIGGEGGGKPRPYIKLYILLFLLIFPLASCDLLPSVTVSITPAASSSNGTQLKVWNRVATGVEVRYEDWKIPGGDDDTVTIVRFDTHKIKVSVGYQPGQPLSINDWAQLEHPLAIINGGFMQQPWSFPMAKFLGNRILDSVACFQ